MPIPGYLYNLRKVGGIWFARIGEWQLSFCRVRRRADYIPPVNAMGIEDSSLDDCFPPCLSARGLDS